MNDIQIEYIDFIEKLEISLETSSETGNTIVIEYINGNTTN